MFDLIDLQAFSSVWYWVCFCALWTAQMQASFGVPQDVLRRASDGDGEAAARSEAVLRARLHVARSLFLSDSAGAPGAALVSGTLTLLGVTGFLYDVEVSQAVFLLLFPLTIARAMAIPAARRIAGGELDEATLLRLLLSHRNRIRVFALLSVFVAAMWGMLQVLNDNPLTL